MIHDLRRQGYRYARLLKMLADKLPGAPRP